VTRSRALRIVGVALLALVAIAVVTYVAGERTEVVVLRTIDTKGVPRETRMWVVDHEGVPWVRVANPERRWFQRLLVDPRAELVRHGATRRVVPEPRDTAEVRSELDRRFREKYGWVDWWYGVLLRRHAIPIRLDPVPGSR
jgi:hypothetical protein